MKTSILITLVISIIILVAVILLALWLSNVLVPRFTCDSTKFSCVADPVHGTYKSESDCLNACTAPPPPEATQYKCSIPNTNSALPYIEKSSCPTSTKDGCCQSTLDPTACFVPNTAALSDPFDYFYLCTDDGENCTLIAAVQDTDKLSTDPSVLREPYSDSATDDIVFCSKDGLFDAIPTRPEIPLDRIRQNQLRTSSRPLLFGRGVGAHTPNSYHPLETTQHWYSVYNLSVRTLHVKKHNGSKTLDPGEDYTFKDSWDNVAITITIVTSSTSSTNGDESLSLPYIFSLSSTGEFDKLCTSYIPMEWKRTMLIFDSTCIQSLPSSSSTPLCTQ